MRNKNLLLTSTKILTALAALCYGLSLQAATVTFAVTGIVDSADGIVIEPNDFGLLEGVSGFDSIFANGSFDNAGKTDTGLESFSLTSLNLLVGNFTFDQTDDTSGAGFPKILFQDGIFAGINFDTTFGTFGSFNSAAELGTFQGFDDNFNATAGHWDVTTFVPVPAAVWLFGSGLVGLAGVARRKRNRI